MTSAVYWDVKHQIKQNQRNILAIFCGGLLEHIKTFSVFVFVLTIMGHILFIADLSPHKT